MGERVPGLTVLAVVLADGSLGPLGEVRPPPTPGIAIRVQAALLDRQARGIGRVSRVSGIVDGWCVAGGFAVHGLFVHWHWPPLHRDIGGRFAAGRISGAPTGNDERDEREEDHREQPGADER